MPFKYRDEAQAFEALRLRFWSYVWAPHGTDCLLFTSGSIRRYAYTQQKGTYQGYGSLSIARCIRGKRGLPKGPRVNAHRVAFLFYGTWMDEDGEPRQGLPPKGWVIDHVRSMGCIGPPCVNVKHLEAVTVAENVRRAWLIRKGDITTGTTFDVDCEYVEPIL